MPLVEEGTYVRSKGPLNLFRSGMRDLRVRPQANEPLLDVLRTLAISFVFCAHFAGVFHAQPAVGRFPVFYWGWSGVDLFFVLSGILIGSQLWRELGKSGRIDVPRFLLRRGMRIWPLYFAFVALVLFEVVFLHRDGSGLWADALFLSNYFHCQIGGGWSLSTEEQFYILAPACLSLLAAFVPARRLWTIGFALLLPIGARWAASSAGDFPPDKQSLFFPFHTHCDGLIVGLVLSWCWVFRPEFFETVKRRLPFAVAMLVLGLGFYAMSRTVLNFTALALVFGAAALLSIRVSSIPAPLNWHGFYVISRLSYGMYLNHFGLLERLGGWLLPARVEGGEPAFWGFLLLSYILSMAVAFCTFQLIEWPFLVLRGRWLQSRTHPKS